MESLGVLLTLPMNPYLEAELHRRCHLFRLWESPPASRKDFLRANAPSIRAVVGNAAVGADANTIDALPRLEIVASYSVGLDKVDLARCRKRGIRVTYTPDVLTDDAADLAIGLSIATLRRLCEADRYVRAGSWKAKGDYKLASRMILCYLLEKNRKKSMNGVKLRLPNRDLVDLVDKMSTLIVA